MNVQQCVNDATIILRWSRGNRSWLMAALIAMVAQLLGIQVTCDQLQANAQQFLCLPPNQQLPALIWLFAQIVPGQIAPVGAGYVFAGDYGGNPPPFSPTSAGAIATDTSTGQQWNWLNGAWQ